MIWAGLILLYCGVAVALLAVIGLYRLPDAYLRIKALALVSFPAAVLLHTATALLVPFGHGGLRSLVTAGLYFLSGPILSHVILLAAHLVKMPRTYETDDLKEEPFTDPP